MKTHRTLPQRRPDQSPGLNYILQINSLAEPHPSVRLGKTNHTLQLTCRSGDPLLLCSRVHPDLSHLDVRLYESVGCCFGEDGLNLGAGVSDVGRKRFDGLSC